jgi:hypothetical protein
MTKAAASPPSPSGSNNRLTSLYHLPLAMLILSGQRQGQSEKNDERR